MITKQKLLSKDFVLPNMKWFSPGASRAIVRKSQRFCWSSYHYIPYKGIQDLLVQLDQFDFRYFVLDYLHFFSFVSWLAAMVSLTIPYRDKADLRSFVLQGSPSYVNAHNTKK